MATYEYEWIEEHESAGTGAETGPRGTSAETDIEPLQQASNCSKAWPHIKALTYDEMLKGFVFQASADHFAIGRIVSRVSDLRFLPSLASSVFVRPGWEVAGGASDDVC